MDTNTNTATGNAKVEAQIGVVSGNAIFHRNETVYQVSGDDTPAHRFEIALNHLNGGSPRIAEELIGKALRDGLDSTKVAYYYAISVLSERSLNQLGSTELSDFDVALRTGRRHDHDEWLGALDVIGNLMGTVIHQEREIDPDMAALNVATSAFSSLPEERRIEINRHLTMILDGAMQDKLDRANTELVAKGRIADDRSKRARKFFQADPAEPKRIEPYFGGSDEKTSWIISAILGVAFLVLLLLGMPGTGLGVMWLFGVLVGAGVAWWFGSMVRAGVARRRRLEYDLGEDNLPPNVKRKRRGSADFRRDVSALVNVRFSDLSLWKNVQLKQLADMHDHLERIRERLKERLILQYGAKRADPETQTAIEHLAGLIDFDGDDKEKPRGHSKKPREVSVATLDWLVKWHAKRVAKQWRNKTLYDFRRITIKEMLAGALAGLGGLVFLMAGLGLAAEATGWGAFGCLVAVVVAALGVGAAIEAMGARRAASLEREDADALHAEERAAYEAELERLHGRPGDAEMARWLDFDKAHLKTLALRHCGLTNRDIIAQVVLTEGAPKAHRARVVYGPPRYSEYFVAIFLLTETGVRVVEFDLDFVDGAVSNETRTAFRYDKLVSARVSEIGVTFADNKGRSVVVLERGRVRVTKEKENMVLSRALRLVLDGDAPDIFIVIENFEGLIDTDVEDKSKLVDLALDSSGVAGAMRVLESVAAEGREWIQRERERRERRWRDWKAAERKVLDNNPDATFTATFTVQQLPESN